MKSNTVVTFLQGAVVFCVLFSAFQCVRAVNRMREVRAITAQFTLANNYLAPMQMLVTDCLEYSKRNPAIDPVLKSSGFNK